MPAYVIVDISVHDPVPYEDYKKMAQKAVTDFGGRYIARGGATDALEGEWNPSRLVILEFPDTATARAWWGSSDYAGAKALRQRCASTKMLLVEGVPTA
jgi:uncharacterized protein (DUF1330 family)